MDSILFWNAVALEANRVSHTNGAGEQTGPPLSARALAIVHLAMYDAYVAVDTAAALPPYLPPSSPVPPGATVQAAVAGAAHTALGALFPSQRSFFDAKLSEAGGPLNPGHDFGVTVARAILKARAGDPGVSDAGYVPSFARFRHRPDPDSPTQGFQAPFYGARSSGIAITGRHVLLAPPPNNAAYLAALREVRGRGIAPNLMGTVSNANTRRTGPQTLIGIFWGYDGSIGLGTPPRLYNQIVRRVAMKRRPGNPNVPNTEAENARLFALVNVAMADAGILAWDQKYFHDFWRPVLGIREHDASMGVADQANNAVSGDTDPGWLPLGAPSTNSTKKNGTPNFPSYPSGHATFGAAAFHITRRFYGLAANDQQNDHLFDDLDFVSDEFNGVSQDNQGTVRPRHLRNFPGGLWQMIIENARSRVYLGVHWVFDSFAVDANNNPDLTQNFGGVPLGLTIANDIFDSGMAVSPVGPRP